MFCQKCGKEISDDATFCSGCGNPVSNNSQSINQQNTQISSKPQKHTSCSTGCLAIVLLILSMAFFGSLIDKNKKASTISSTPQSAQTTQNSQNLQKDRIIITIKETEAYKNAIKEYDEASKNNKKSNRISINDLLLDIDNMKDNTLIETEAYAVVNPLEEDAILLTSTVGSYKSISVDTSKLDRETRLSLLNNADLTKHFGALLKGKIATGLLGKYIEAIELKIVGGDALTLAWYTNDLNNKEIAKNNEIELAKERLANANKYQITIDLQKPTEEEIKVAKVVQEFYSNLLIYELTRYSGYFAFWTMTERCVVPRTKQMLRLLEYADIGYNPITCGQDNPEVWNIITSKIDDKNATVEIERFWDKQQKQKDDNNIIIKLIKSANHWLIDDINNAKETFNKEFLGNKKYGIITGGSDRVPGAMLYSTINSSNNSSNFMLYPGDKVYLLEEKGEYYKINPEIHGIKDSKCCYIKKKDVALFDLTSKIKKGSSCFLAFAHFGEPATKSQNTWTYTSKDQITFDSFKRIVSWTGFNDFSDDFQN